MISIQDFFKIELKIARIKEVKEHPNADRLYILKVDVGGDERQLVAGIRSSYTNIELIGREVVIVSNLEPAVIRGEKSEGMLLAVSDEKGISIISPDRDVPSGSKVR